MKLRIRSCFALIFLAVSVSAIAQDDFANFLSRYPEAREPETVDRPPVHAHYARTAFNTVEVYRVSKGTSSGLVVILDDIDLPGPSLSFNKVRFVQKLIDRGIAVAYVSNRPATRFGMVQAAKDIAQGISYVYAHPDKFRVAGPMAVVGIGTGAAHAGMLGCDPALLGEVGFAFDQLHAVVAINSTGLNGPIAVAAASQFNRKRFLRAFGDDENAQRASSTIGHIGAPDAPVFYFLNQDQPVKYGGESAIVADRLRASGAEVVVDTMPAQGGGQKAKIFGDEDNVPSEKLRLFLEAHLR